MLAPYNMASAKAAELYMVCSTMQCHSHDFVCCMRAYLAGHGKQQPIECDHAVLTRVGSCKLLAEVKTLPVMNSLHCNLCLEEGQPANLSGGIQLWTQCLLNLTWLARLAA